MSLAFLDQRLPTLPTATGVKQFMIKVWTWHKVIAELRGYDALTLQIPGQFDHDHPYDPCDGPPTVDDQGFLQMSTWRRGDKICVEGQEQSAWTIQNRLLIELWGGKRLPNLYADITTFVRPLEGALQRPAPVVDPVFLDLKRPREIPINVEGALVGIEPTIRHLVCCCTYWGDWSPVHSLEFFRGMSRAEAETNSAAVILMENHGLIRCERLPKKQYFIHILPPFFDALQAPTLA